MKRPVYKQNAKSSIGIITLGLPWSEMIAIEADKISGTDIAAAIVVALIRLLRAERTPTTETERSCGTMPIVSRRCLFWPLRTSAPSRSAKTIMLP